MSNWRGNVQYVKRNTEARSCNKCCNRKTIIITYSEYVALGTVSEIHVHQIVICGLSGSPSFLRIIK